MDFNHEILSIVWSKASIVFGYNQNQVRKDICGAIIVWADYGNRDSKYGWEVDHINPIARGGSDAIGNLRPLHWQNNARKSDGSLVCAVRG